MQIKNAMIPNKMEQIGCLREVQWATQFQIQLLIKKSKDVKINVKIFKIAGFSSSNMDRMGKRIFVSFTSLVMSWLQTINQG